MHCVNVMYPRRPNSEFDLKHYLEVHNPLGIGLLYERLGVLPKRILIQKGTYGADGTADSADYHVIASVLFDTKEQADQFLVLFGMEEPRRLLTSDWPKYTEADPIVVLGEIVELDPEEVAARGPEVIRKATAELETT